MCCRRILLFTLLTLLAGCSDVVTDSYPTLEDAREARLFARGWLPDILPASTERLKVSNNLDLSNSHGEFYFAPQDYEEFVSQLTLYAKTGNHESMFTALASDAELSDYAAFTFSNNRCIWFFQCSQQEGHCLYNMRLENP